MLVILFVRTYRKMNIPNKTDNGNTTTNIFNRDENHTHRWLKASFHSQLMQ